MTARVTRTAERREDDGADGQHAAAIDRLIAAASGLAATIAATEALIQQRSEILTDPMLVTRPLGRRRFDLVPLAEAARRLDRNPEVLRRWCADGRVQGVRIGRTWWLRAETVDLLAEHANRGRPRLPTEARR